MRRRLASGCSTRETRWRTVEDSRPGSDQTSSSRLRFLPEMLAHRPPVPLACASSDRRATGGWVMEAFEHIAKVALEAEGFVVSTNIKSP